MGHTFDATWREEESTDFSVKQWDAFDDPSESTCQIWCYLPYRWPRYYTLKFSLARHTYTHTDIQTDRVMSIPLNPLRGWGKITSSKCTHNFQWHHQGVHNFQWHHQGVHIFQWHFNDICTHISQGLHNNALTIPHFGGMFILRKISSVLSPYGDLYNVHVNRAAPWNLQDAIDFPEM